MVQISDVQIFCADVTSLGSLGGVCCGRADMVRVQRLNGSGYMYSASNPPYVASAGTAALDALDEHPEMIQSLQKKSALLHSLLKEIPRVEIESYENCPFVIMRLEESIRPEDRLSEAKVYQQIVEMVRERGVAIVRTKYTRLEKYPPPPQIKVAVMVQHSDEQLRKVADVVRQSIQEAVAQL